ncbi:MAG: TetR/AcrR family transcriptional regulator [Gammaproteobacteria bacterium]
MQAGTETYDRILMTARQLIHARSYADVGVAAICQQAGVKKGSFYHFFPSKQALTLAILETVYQDMQAMLAQAFAPDRPPLARLARFGQLAYEFQLQIKQATGQVAGCPFGNLASELATRDEAIRCKVVDIFARLQQATQSCLQEAVATGEIPPLDIEATAQAMFAYMEGLMLLAKTHNDPEILRQLLPAISQIRIPPRSAQEKRMANTILSTDISAVTGSTGPGG